MHDKTVGGIRTPHPAAPRRRLLRPQCWVGGMAGTLLLWQPALAAQIDTGDSGMKLRWDNTFKYSNAFRLRERNPVLVNGSNPAAGDGLNQDDGDRNFSRGLISNRIDWLSEADLSYRNVGARVSAAAWYDSVYNRRNDNDSAGLFGPGTSSANSYRGVDEFTAGTRQLNGRKAEVLDAFVFGKFSIGDSSGSVRLGRHALVWGESLFLGANAIAGAQSPTDLIKAVSVPNSQVKEIVMPVPQVSGQFSITPDVSVGAYYQFQHRASRFPGAGSYFSSGDTGPDGGDFSAVGPFIRIPVRNQKARNSGQGGMQLRFTALDTDFGLYAIRFHDKSFQGVPTLGAVQTSPPGTVPPTIGIQPTAFNFVFHENVTAFGASFSHTFGAANIAAEVSIRRNMDLASSRAADLTALAPMALAPNDNRDNPAYAVGRTAHVNLSTIWTVPRTALWEEASLMGEVAWNRMLSCQKNCDALDPRGSRDAAQIQVVFSPVYNQVLPGVNITVPLGLTYTPKGSRSLAVGAGVSGPDGGGTFNFGVQGSYRDVWRFGASFSHYFGPADTFTTTTTDANRGPQNNFSWAQTLRDRDFLSLSLSRTF